LEKYNYSHLYKEEIEKTEKNKEKHKRSVERCVNMYEKGKIKNEINRLMFHKNEEVKEQNELSLCTWKPELNKRNNKKEENLKVLYSQTKIYNRTQSWKLLKAQKISKSKSQLNGNAECTYHPRVNSTQHLGKVFDEKKNNFSK